MVNYFFISSPLHFYICCNLCIKRKNEKNILIFISKHANIVNKFITVAKQNPSIFNNIHVLLDDKKKYKLYHRKKTLNHIKEIIKNECPNNIFTGNDGRVEFQYAMYVARKMHIDVKGCYYDDGTASYMFHKKMGSIKRQYIEKYLKKLIYGTWCESPRSIGDSSWVSIAYLAFPEFAHKYLKEKERIQIDASIFEDKKFIYINQLLLKDSEEINLIDFSKINKVICIAHEKVYSDYIQTLIKIKKTFIDNDTPTEIGIKAHPRSSNIEVIKNIYPGSVILPNSIGMETILPKLNKNVIIYGDISTVLLTTKWLKPNAELKAFDTKTSIMPSKNLRDLFKKLKIDAEEI